MTILDLERKISSGRSVIEPDDDPVRLSMADSSVDSQHLFTNPFLAFWQNFFIDVKDNVEKSPKIHLSSLAVTCFMTVVLMMTGMTIVVLPNWLNSVFADETTKMIYHFQVPVAVFMGAFLGPILGTSAVLLYVLTGLFLLPVFASGGGLEYLTNPGFGFIVGMMLSACYAGYYIRQMYKNKKPFLCSVRILGVGFFAVLLTHLCGIIALAGLSLSGAMTFDAFQHWVMQYSLKPLPYDILAALTFMCCVRYTRIFLYPALY